jgi:hypothetical protein
MRKLLLGLGGAISATLVTFFLLCPSMAANAADWQSCVLRGGKPSCPEYVTIVPSKATDGSMDVPPNVSTTLFGGITPPNGFVVQVLPTNFSSGCWVNDHGPAASGAGFQFSPLTRFRHAARLQTHGTCEYFL